MLLRFNALCLLLLASAAFAPYPSSSAAAAGDEPPQWLRQVAGASAPAYDRKVPAVVLLDEETVTVGADGRIRTVATYAVRVLTREGRDEAVARVPYTTNSDKVKELRAWLIYANGSVKKYGEKETADIAFVDNDVYNDLRAKLILAGRDAEPGAVFGYQAVTEERSPFSQLSWQFQSGLPTLLSRYTV
ncbi:MAG TPA: DUF3857 domain-containing protein, partial [Pyrinomonadaceae bacterium]|nr:DUF3857 domain-containing protein [Pyrinomonadaceae bacterium]